MKPSSGGRYGVRLILVGDAEIPGHELFWMTEWDKWFPLAFQSVLIQGNGVTALVSTGPAEDLGPMNEAMAVHERVARTADHPLTLYDPDQLDRYPGGLAAPGP